MHSAVEISMYPLTGDYRPLIQAFIDRLNTHPDLTVQTNSLSTQVWGPLDRVMAILAAEIERSGRDVAAAGLRHEGVAGPWRRRDPAELCGPVRRRVARDELGRDPRGRSRGRLSAARDPPVDQLLDGGVRQFLPVRLGAVRRAPVHGVRAECVLCGHGGLRVLAVAATAVRGAAARRDAAGRSAATAGGSRRRRLSVVSCYFLRRYTPAAWPFVDSMVTWASVFATFLVARKVYENWHWWLLIDSASLCLCFTRRLYLTMLLFALYLVLIVIGMREWRRNLPLAVPCRVATSNALALDRVPGRRAGRASSAWDRAS